MKKLGIDLGGTKIEGIFLDENYKVITRKRIPTPKNKYDEIVNSTVELINLIKTDESTIGICTPGAISKKTGRIKNSNTQCLIGKPFKEDLEEKIGSPIKMENDANCFALAEAILGSAQNYDLVFGVIMGTGVGGGIVINQRLHKGRTNIAGEWGHHQLFAHGKSCYCGKSGCVETYISGPALEQQWFELTGETKSLQDIIQKQQRPQFIQWKTQFLDNFATGLANVIDILDPDAIVLGGGLSNIDFLYDEGVSVVHAKVFSDLVDTPILKNKLGDSAGVFGACLI